jgi:hypothetical protein
MKGGEDRAKLIEVQAETYRQMHEIARELGYPSILEALEAAPAPPSLSPGVGCEHTPGPWQFFPSASATSVTLMAALAAAERSGVIDTAIGVDSTNGTIIAEVVRGKQFKANARLIAAAPDMFEALRRIAEMTDIEADFDGFEAREIAIAALARAKGDRA